MSETAPAGTFTPRDGTGKPGSCGLPMPRIEMKFIDVADPSRDLPLGRARRNLRQGAERDEGLLEEARRDRRLDDGGRLLPHRRRRLHGRGRLRLHRRPHQGHAARRRLQRLSAHHRGGDLQASVGRGGQRHRRAGRLSRRDPEGLRQAEGRRAAADLRRHEGVPQGPARQARDDRRPRNPRRAAEDGGRQDLEEGPAGFRAGATRAEPSLPTAPLPGTSAPGERGERRTWRGERISANGAMSPPCWP